MNQKKEMKTIIEFDEYLRSEPHYFDNGAVENRVFSISSAPSAEKIVFVANWRAKKKHWKGFLYQLAQHRELSYFETREKSATRFKERTASFTVEAMGNDVANYLNQIEGPYHLIGVSIGANAIVKAWGAISRRPQSLVLICPILRLKMPAYFRLFRYIPDWMIKIIAPAVHGAMANSRQLRNVSKNLYEIFRNRDIRELKLIKSSAQDLLKMRMALSDFQNIDRPALIVSAIDDDIHPAADAEAIARALPGAASVSVANFRAAHDAGCARKLIDWYRSVLQWGQWQRF